MEPEVATQLGYSLMGLLHLYHDYVVWKKESADKDPPTGSHKQTRLNRRAMMLRGGKVREDAIRLALSAAAVKPAEPKMPVSAEKARDEIAARKMALILYLLRDPVLATVTKPATGKAGDDIRRDGWFLLNRARRWNIYSGGSMLDFALRNNEVD
ncbi:hypothetical protein PF007_g29481 [Phytophthora fragariae]|uniref:Peroxisomal membrane protein PEX16 n=1 Tax=Phytophthora fragariae TaxID=53985 RepID=A0A6A3PMI5_9STRA|nr:hypothetical protein PF007_g29481 [Phytophthora fragariae]